MRLRDQERVTDRDFSPLVAVKGHFMLHVTQAFARLKHAYVIV